jgi:hypothetical protein
MKIWALVPQTGTVLTDTYIFFFVLNERARFCLITNFKLEAVWYLSSSATSTVKLPLWCLRYDPFWSYFRRQQYLRKDNFFTSMLNLHVCLGIISWGFTWKSSKYIKKLFWGGCGKAKQHFASFRFWVFPLQTRFCFYKQCPSVSVTNDRFQGITQTDPQT